MNFAAILAGGKGTRMGVQDKPKQFLMLADKPIIIHTIEKFLAVSEFERVIVLVPEAWLRYTLDLVRRYLGEDSRVIVLQGGDSRNDTIMCAVGYIREQYGIDDNTVLCTHDSVRPFVTYRIIQDNLRAMQVYDACDTVVPSSDTIVESLDDEVISSIPLRSRMYQGQTPQTFRVSVLCSIYDTLSEDEKSALTDACKICVLGGCSVGLVKGETFNIKITYASDLKVAHALLGMGA